MNIFDIVGPIMVGPSSSHTAGACKIGNVYKKIFGSTPKEVFVTFYGSFADTYKGHGTDKAIVGGLIGYSTYDKRIVTSLEKAEELGMHVHFSTSSEEMPHPNTVAISASHNGKEVNMVAESVGGGNIIVREIDGVAVKLDGSTNAIVISHHDQPGVISYVTNILNDYNINIATMIVSRVGKHEDAGMVIEIDELPSDDLSDAISKNNSIYTYRIIEKL